MSLCTFHLVNKRDSANLELLIIAESFSLHQAINCIRGQKFVICSWKTYFNGNTINILIEGLLQFLGVMKILK